MKTLFIVIVVTLFLQGCAKVGYVAAAVEQKAVAVADGILDSGYKNSCKRATLGAVERKYRGNAQGLRNLAGYCWESGTSMHTLFSEMADKIEAAK